MNRQFYQQKKLNPENLAERIIKAKVALKKEIELLKISNRKPTENGNKMLFDLVGDLYDLVVLARKNNTNPIAIKTDRIWKEQIYPFLIIIKQQIYFVKNIIVIKLIYYQLNINQIIKFKLLKNFVMIVLNKQMIFLWKIMMNVLYLKRKNILIIKS